MLLNLSDLIETAQKLKSIIDHSQQELDAVQLLIKGMEMRSGEQDNTHKKRSLFQDTIYQVDRFQGAWFTGRQITDNLITAGVRKSSDRTRLQSIVAHYLKKLYEQGKLDRENLEPNTSRGRFKYRQIINEGNK